MHNLEVPYFSPIGIAEIKEELGFHDIFRKVNSFLKEKYRLEKSVFVFDYDGFLSYVGKSAAFDYRMYYLADMKLSIDFLPWLVNEYMGYVIPQTSLNKRCIVLDLDNTLWGGLAGEDGIDGIVLGPKPPGNQFMEFQKILLSLHSRGILLAINSSNNYEDAMNIIENHPFMILRKKHFASIKINWKPKEENMIDIANEINFGTDSFVFIDDLPENREKIADLLPEISVLDLPADPSFYAKKIVEDKEFSYFAITEEDYSRGELYMQRSDRNNLKLSSKSMDEFLESLNLSAKISFRDYSSVSRISQLCMKTNQFNLTTKRYSEKDIKLLMDSPNYEVYSLSAKDRFGDHGLVAVAIVKKEGTAAEIDSFLMSCRVMGYKLEDVFCMYILEKLAAGGIQQVSAEFISTAKNAAVREFYASLGFDRVSEENGHIRWHKNITGFRAVYPKWIILGD